MWQLDDALGHEMYDDLALAVEFVKEISDTQSFAVLDDPDHAEELRDRLSRIKQRVTLLGKPLELRKINDLLRQDEHLSLMYQQM